MYILEQISINSPFLSINFLFNTHIHFPLWHIIFNTHIHFPLWHIITYLSVLQLSAVCVS